MAHDGHRAFTVGSLFAGIGGFDLGFERAGWRTAWQVEINPVHRAHLALRFPGAKQFADVTSVEPSVLGPVRCITAGFPCQDASTMGASRAGGRRGLSGPRTGLFWHVVRIARELKPRWLVLENVPGLFSVNAGRDFASIIGALSECGYLGAWRVLDAQYFGVPQRRRRVYLVAGLDRPAPLDFLADAAAMDDLPCPAGPQCEPQGEVCRPLYCLTAPNSASRINLGSEVLVAEQGGWRAMAGRGRSVELHGFPAGLAEPDYYARYASGNAVVPHVARWLAAILMRADQPEMHT